MRHAEYWIKFTYPVPIQKYHQYFGSDPGFAAGHNGGTHTTWEDMALLRSIPDVVICDAADAVQMDWIIKEFSKLSGYTMFVVRKVFEMFMLKDQPFN